MNEVMMVPVQDFNRLQDYYKGQITENALLDKAGRLAAEQHIILKDKRIPDSIAVKMAKPIASEESKLVKRIRTGKSGPISYQGTAQPEGMVDTPVENLLKQILKGANKEQAPPVIIKQEPLDTTGLKKELKTPKPTIQSKPSKRSSKSLKGSVKKAALSAGRKQLLSSLGIEDDDGGYSPKGKAKTYKKAKKTEAEKLREGWEDWDAPIRRRLRYDSD